MKVFKSAMMRSASVRRMVFAAGASIAFAAPGSAETLNEALAATYRYSPAIDAQRSRLRATDEGVALANTAFRPRIVANGDIGWEHTINGGQNATNLAVGANGQLTSGGPNRTSGYGFSLSQPLFTGGQLTKRLATAEANVRAGREILRDVERSVFLQAVAAYADVILTSDIQKYQERNIESLNRQVRGTKERLATNELTNTDVAQTEARRALALAQLDVARANAKTARANYLQIVGNEPNGLVEPALPAKLLPKSLAEAQAIGAQENPLIINALYNEEAARHQVEQIRGQLLPQISLNAQWDDRYNSNPGDAEYTRSGTVGGRMTLPLYDGGQIHSEVRQAKEIHLSFIQTIELVRAQTQQGVAGAWMQMEAARLSVEHNLAAIKADKAALDGVHKEESIGQRTYLDILNAEQELLSSQNSLANAKRNLIVSAYNLLFQIGRLDADRLSIVANLYDPTVHYDEVRRKWFGLSITHADGRTEYMNTAAEPRTASK